MINYLKIKRKEELYGRKKEEVIPENKESKKLNNKKSKGISPTTFLVLLVTIPLIVYAFTDNDLDMRITKKNIVNQQIVYIQEGSMVYKTLNDAILETNGKTGYYDTSEQRFVLSTFYEYNGEYKRFNITDENYIINTTYILENGGKITCYLTSIDGITPEGYYPADSVILTNQKNQTKRIG